MKMVFLLFVLYSATGLSVKYKGFEAVKNSKVSKAFDPEYSSESTCHPGWGFYQGGEDDASEFEFRNKEEGSYELSVSSDGNTMTPSLSVFELKVGPDKAEKVLVSYNCEGTGWDIVTLSVTGLDNGNEDFELTWRKFCGESSAFDWGLFILLITAISIVYLAAYRARIVSPWESSIDDQSDVLTVHHAYGFVIVGSLALILLFFFKKYLIYVLEFLLAFSGTFSIMGVLNEFNIESLWPNMYTLPVFGATSGATLVSLFISALFIILYFFTKFWLLNNLIGLCFAYLIIKTVKIPNFKVGGLLLGLAFFYDIFWVFFSQYAFGDNVMVSVASGLDLPIKIECPHFTDSAYPYSCSMLGLGDLALPGLFLAFASRLDFQNGTNYLKVLIGCYSAALVMCILVLVVFEHAQPALLYISPMLIFGMLGNAYYRQEVKEIFQGVNSRTPLIRPMNDIPMNELGN